MQENLIPERILVYCPREKWNVGRLI